MKIRCILFSFLLCFTLIANSQRIAVLNDIHVTPGSQADSMLVVAVDEINCQKFDAVIINGDLTNEGSDEQLQNVKEKLDKVVHPLFVLPGNHENTWSQSATSTFPKLWGNDRFSTVIGDVLLVGINCGPYMKMGDGHVKREDLAWLEKRMDEPDHSRVLSFNHYPIRKDDIDDYMDYAQVLTTRPVIAHINGHYHVPIQYDIAEGAVPGFMLRSFIPSKNCPGYSYSIIEIESDTLKIFEKHINGPQNVVFSIPVKLPDGSATIDNQHKPQRRVYADNASVFTRPLITSNRIYFANSMGEIKAIDRNTLQPILSIPTGRKFFSRPIALNSGKIAYPNDEGIFLVDEEKGQVVDTLSAGFSTPYVADGLICSDKYLQGGFKKFECRDRQAGKLIWIYDSIDNYCQGAPAVDGDIVVFGAWDTFLRCIDLKTGELKWKWSNGKRANMLGPGNVVPAICGERVYVVAPDRYMTAIDRTTGETIWRNSDHKYRESMGVSADGKRIYAKTMDGELVVVDATTPEFSEIATIDLGLGYEHAPCPIAESRGKIYIGSRRGIVTIVDATTLEILEQLTLGTSEVNGFDVDPTDGTVAVSLIEGVVCVL